MKTGHVSPLLADYLDGLLSPDEASAVKEHLARCAECREERRFLKTYMKEAAAFPRLPVPEDFLEKIHARIDAPAPGGIFRTLFFPLNIKLPLEAAGALALTVLAVFIFKPFGEREIEYHAEAPAVSETAAEPGKKMDEDATGRRGGDMLAREESRARAIDHITSEKKAEAPSDTGRLTVANGAEGAKIASAEDRAEKEAAADMSLVLKPSRPEGAATGTKDASRSKDSRQGLITSLRQKGAYDAQAESDSTEYTRAAELPSKNQAGVDVIVNLAGALGGRVIRVSDEDATGSRRLVIVEIPAKNYAQFISGIQRAWSVREQTPSAPPGRAGRLRLTMSLQD